MHLGGKNPFLCNAHRNNLNLWINFQKFPVRTKMVCLLCATQISKFEQKDSLTLIKFRNEGTLLLKAVSQQKTHGYV